MNLLQHWHPAIASQRLKKRPIAVDICGQTLVLFRTQQGQAVALRDRCCHRGMKLSCGQVQGEEIVCPYHGWQYAASGQVSSPGTLKLNAKVSAFDVVERYGFVWLKSADSSTSFPDFQVSDDFFAGTLVHEIDAPLEAVLDNFSEVEHTPTVHTNFGYASQAISNVETFVATTDNSVRVTNKGIQQSLPPLVEKVFFNISSGDYFFDNWETFFSPVYSIYDQFWLNPQTGQKRGLNLKLVAFLVPISHEKTRFMMFVFVRPTISRLIFKILAHPIKAFINHELKKDKNILNNLADKKMSLSEMQLGRFDRALIENRKRIDRIYRSNASQPTMPKQLLS